MCKTDRRMEKRWWGSYSKTVEFCQANRGPISEKDTCKLTDEPIARMFTDGQVVGRRAKWLHLVGGGAPLYITVIKGRIYGTLLTESLYLHSLATMSCYTVQVENKCLRQWGMLKAFA